MLCTYETNVQKYVFNIYSVKSLLNTLFEFNW